MPTVFNSRRAKKRAIKWRLTQIIKASRGCADCGYNAHGVALQFDHMGDKKGNVSNLIRSDYAWSTILEEIETSTVKNHDNSTTFLLNYFLKNKQ